MLNELFPELEAHRASHNVTTGLQQRSGALALLSGALAPLSAAHV